MSLGLSRPIEVSINSHFSPDGFKFSRVLSDWYGLDIYYWDMQTRVPASGSGEVESRTREVVDS